MCGLLDYYQTFGLVRGLFIIKHEQTLGKKMLPRK